MTSIYLRACLPLNGTGLLAAGVIFLGPIVCDMASRGQNITVQLQWDGMGPLRLQCGMGIGREAGTPFINGDHTKTEMGWDGMG